MSDEITRHGKCISIHTGNKSFFTEYSLDNYDGQSMHINAF